MQHFQSILIVIGLIAIGGVLIHGYLVGRKEKESVTERGTKVDIFAEKTASEEYVEPADEVLGEVRIISNRNDEPDSDSIDFSKALTEEKVASFDFNENEQQENVSGVETTNKENEDTSVSIIIDDSIEETPLVNNDSLSADVFIEEDTETHSEVKTHSEPEIEEVVQTQDLFIFNVAAQDGKLLGGHELLQFFLTSGFRHGEMSIFHRHENSDGTGPVLFSIANMMAPGIFDTDNMEQFKSEGVSFFLTAPNKDINIKASFDLMLRAVEQMAEEFECEVLNAEREKMTTAQFIEYNNRLLHYI